jgi:hypothetical protein
VPTDVNFDAVFWWEGMESFYCVDSVRDVDHDVFLLRLFGVI